MRPASWALHLSIAAFAFVGLATSCGFLVAGGVFRVPALHGWRLEGLAVWAVLGALPVLGAGAAWWWFWRQRRDVMVVSIAASSILFTAGLFTWGSVAIDAHKAPRALVQIAQAQQTDRDIRVGCYQYFLPSLVFYCRREVKHLDTEEQVLEFLRCPLTVYLFVPATLWEKLEAKVCGPHRLVARHRDLYRSCEVVVAMNR
jgi:hypothetical protein